MRPDRARDAVLRALRLRSKNAIAANDAVCPIDLAVKLGLEVRSLRIGSLEGLYVPGPGAPRIVLGAERPRGRRNFTCAHEIGHHIYGHGEQVDEVKRRNLSHGRPLEEFLADRFAAALLMPKLAVLSAFKHRGWLPAEAEATEVFIVASELGVGYRALLRYMSTTLGMMRENHAQKLMRVQPKTIKAGLLPGERAYPHVVVVDEGWRRRNVDIDVDDVVLLSGLVDVGHSVEAKHLPDGSVLVRGMRPGVVSFANSKVQGRIRISKRCYAGLAEHRHLEDEEYNEEEESYACG